MGVGAKPADVNAVSGRLVRRPKRKRLGVRYGREPEKGRNPESWSSHRGVEKRGYWEGVSS